MATYRELVYLVIDLTKLISDDSTLNENHVKYLLERYRTYLLEQKYKNNNYAVPINNTQSFCVPVKLINMKQACGACGNSCLDSDDDFVFKSINEVPNLLNVGDPIGSFAVFHNCSKYSLIMEPGADKLWDAETIAEINEFFGEEVLSPSLVGAYSMETIYEDTCKTEVQDVKAILEKKYDENYDFSIGNDQAQNCDQVEVEKARAYNNMSMVSYERFPYVGNNRYMKNKIYAMLGMDHHLYVKSSAEGFYGDDEEDVKRIVYLNGVFEDPLQAMSATCDTGITRPGLPDPIPCVDNNGYNHCEPLDNKFPIEDALITQLLALVINAIRQNVYNPNDKLNNANDDLSSIEQFVRTYMKDKYVKGNEGEYQQ